MLPVLGRVVVERQQLVEVVGDLGDGAHGAAAEGQGELVVVSGQAAPLFDVAEPALDDVAVAVVLAARRTPGSLADSGCSVRVRLNRSMLLCSSSRGARRLGSWWPYSWSGQVGVDLSGDVALQTSDDLAFAESFGATVIRRTGCATSPCSRLRPGSPVALPRVPSDVPLVARRRLPERTGRTCAPGPRGHVGCPGSRDRQQASRVAEPPPPQHHLCRHRFASTLSGTGWLRSPAPGAARCPGA